MAGTEDTRDDLVVSRHYGDPDQNKQYWFEQYKLYVEIADRISARRATANRFFLAANSALLAALAVFLRDFGKDSTASGFLIAIALVVVGGGMAVCWRWGEILRSYTQKSDVKGKLINLIETEKRVPFRLWDIEREMLDKRNNHSWVTDLEQKLSWVFFGVYAFLLALLLCAMACSYFKWEPCWVCAIVSFILGGAVGWVCCGFWGRKQEDC